MSRKLTYTLLTGLVAVGISSCISNGDNPGIEYAPNMYVSEAYEPYSQDKKFETNPNGMTMRLPVNGTVARGQLHYIYPYPNTAEGYQLSEAYVPQIAATKDNLIEGERLYNIYCWHCHGKKGKNDGPIFSSNKMPSPPWTGYQDDYIQKLSVGRIYHTITYGKGFMGSHAAMLSPEQRWQVIYYVKYLSLGTDFQIAKDDSDIIPVQASDSVASDSNN
jgi:mono/diheme cytochrome c family protein